MIYNNLLTEIFSILSDIESIETRKKISRGFTKRGFNKVRAYDLMRDKNLFNHATDIELLIFVTELNNLSEKKISVEKYFNKDEIENFNKIKLLDEYIPSNYDENNIHENYKLEFINDSYMNENTKRTFWHLYTTLIKCFEEKFNKDLCEFNLIQIEEMIKGINVAITTKRNLISFIDRYNDWCVDYELTDSNNLEGVDLKSLLTAPGIDRSSSYISFEELYKNCIWLENKADNDIIMLDVMIALLMRSGLRTSDIVNMRYSDINFETGDVEFKSDEKIIKLHLENYIVKIIKEVKETVWLIGAAKRPLLIVDDHVVKVLDPEYNKEKVANNIRKRMSKFKVCYRPLNENILINSLKFDDLNDIEKSNGSVAIKDYKSIQEKYGNNPSSYQKLREDYLLYKQSIK